MNVRPNFMCKPFLVVLGCIFFASPVVLAQSPKPTATAPSNTASSAERGVKLAEAGRCAEALPLLKHGSATGAGPELRRSIGMAGVKCAMALDQRTAAVDFLQTLTREFPRDPAVLYLATHVYSDLSLRASQELAATAPNSREAQQLDAEALETQGKWAEAEAEYRKILEQNPQAQGIHYRLGEIILSRPATTTTGTDAKAEFEAELLVDPTNAGAEYVLGELARGSQQWDEAIAHFEKAVKLDPAFADAFRGLGMALNAAGKFSDATVPLEKYVKMQPNDPAGHYQLAIAYARSGRKDEASRQMELQRELDAKARQRQNGQAPDQSQ